MASGTTRFGAYELVRRLGAGGMAETFLAIRRGPGGFEQKVCIKRILPAFEMDLDFVKMFLEEARVSARLRHANIAQVLDFGVIDDSHFLALELIEGVDLHGLLRAEKEKGQNLTSGLVSYLALELAAALDFAHDAGPDGAVRGVVHRDISPSNVLLSTAGEVKLTDFGIAKAITGTVATRSGVVKGKVPYMAPEYARTGKFDARADLFALGVMLYECLAGERPYDGVTDLDTLERSTQGRHVPLSERVPGAPRLLTDAIERLIDPEPSDRFANAAALLDALVDVAPPPTARRILGELVRRHVRPAPEPARDKSPVAFEPTQSATPIGPSGTQALPGATPAATAREVQPSAPDDPTRTRTPDRQQIPHTRPSDPAQEAPGPVAAGSAPTGPLPVGYAAPAEPPSSPSVPRVPAVDTSPSLPLRRTRPLFVWGLIGAVLLAVGLVLWVSSLDTRETLAASTAEDPAPTLPDPAPGGMEAPAPTAEPDPDVEPAVAAMIEPEQPPPDPPEPAPHDRRPVRVEPPPVEPTPPDREPPPNPFREEPVRPAAQSGRLHVVVYPFGDVWIDGAHRGASPVNVQLSAGRHTVRAGDGAPTETRSVEVPAGGERTVIIHLR